MIREAESSNHDQRSNDKTTPVKQIAQKQAHPRKAL
jgi:hypothetical protein